MECSWRFGIPYTGCSLEDAEVKFPSLLVLVMLSTAAVAGAEAHRINTEKAVMTVRVYKAGLLSAFVHDHEISAPIASGTVDAAARQVDLRVNAKALRLQDSKGSDKEHEQIQSTMLGPQVLDADRYAEITFRSTRVDAGGASAWVVHGELGLHGQTHPVEVQVKEAGGRYTGSCTFKQSDFGIKPVKVAGGTVRVKDEVRIEFDIPLL